MSSSRNVKKSCDVEASKAAGAGLSDPTAAGAVPAHILEFLSFQSELERSEAGEAANHAPNASPRPTHTYIVPTPSVAAEGVVVVYTLTPETEIHPSGSSSTPVHITEVEAVLESMPPPLPGKRETVLGLPAPSAIPAVAPKSLKRPAANPDAAKKRRCTRDSEAGPSCNLGKTVSSLLKAKEVKVAKSSELRRLKRKVKGGEESTASAIEGARESVCAEFRSRLARIADALDSLSVIHARDLALASVDGVISEAQLFLGETPPSPRAEEARLSIRKAALAEEKGEFDLTLAGQKSECTLLSYSVISEDQDPIAEDGGSAAPNPERMIGEDEAPGAEEV
ncbi:hypothetical protein Bca101_082991 [Brassica carinata]